MSLCIPSKGYWLITRAPNVFRVGINPTIFKDVYQQDLIEHIYLNNKLKNKSVIEGEYAGSLINENLEAIHFEVPLNGKIVEFNNQLPYSIFMLNDLIKVKHWLFTIKINNKFIKKNKKSNYSFKI